MESISAFTFGTKQSKKSELFAQKRKRDASNDEGQISQRLFDLLTVFTDPPSDCSGHLYGAIF
jgi:hypothetical protein